MAGSMSVRVYVRGSRATLILPRSERPESYAALPDPGGFTGPPAVPRACGRAPAHAPARHEEGAFPWESRGSARCRRTVGWGTPPPHSPRAAVRAGRNERASRPGRRSGRYSPGPGLVMSPVLAPGSGPGSPASASVPRLCLCLRLPPPADGPAGTSTGAAGARVRRDAHRSPVVSPSPTRRRPAPPAPPAPPAADARRSFVRRRARPHTPETSVGRPGGRPTGRQPECWEGRTGPVLRVLVPARCETGSRGSPRGAEGPGPGAWRGALPLRGRRLCPLPSWRLLKSRD